MLVSKANLVKAITANNDAVTEAIELYYPTPLRYVPDDENANAIALRDALDEADIDYALDGSAILVEVRLADYDRGTGWLIELGERFGFKLTK